MRLRISASAVSDAAGIPYPHASIPDPEAFKAFQKDRDALAKAPESLLGRDRNLPTPQLRKGITIVRGSAPVEVSGVDEEYFRLVKADRLLIIEKLGEDVAAPVAAAPAANQYDDRRPRR